MSADILRRLSDIKLSRTALREVLALIADLMEGKEDGRAKERDKKRKQRGTLEGHEGDKVGDKVANVPGDKKEIPPTPPKEKTIPQGSREPFGSRPKRVRTSYSSDFEGFWKIYPRTPLMSKSEAFKVWGKLSENDRKTALDSVPKFKSFLSSKPDHPTVHACRFLSQRRFDGFAEAAESEEITVIGFYAPADSPELIAWDRQRGKQYPRDRNGGWHFPTQWPPGHEQHKAA